MSDGATGTAATSAEGTVRAVCFDLDDTLFDYHDYARAGLRAAADRLEERTDRSHLDELERLYFDDSVTEGTFDHLVERNDLDPDLVDGLVEAFHEPTTPLDPYPETECVLDRLEDRYDLGVVTDGRGGREKLDRLGIDDYFDAVVVTPEFGGSKHGRAAFDAVLSTLGCDPGATVYVGDDPRVDFRIPNDLGMGTVRLRRGRYADLDPEGDDAAPDVEIETLAGLPELLE